MIYFAAFGPDLIKIGYSVNVSRRIEQWRAYHRLYRPDLLPTDLIGTIPGDVATEQRLLRQAPGWDSDPSRRRRGAPPEVRDRTPDLEFWVLGQLAFYAGFCGTPHPRMVGIGTQRCAPEPRLRLVSNGTDSSG